MESTGSQLPLILALLAIAWLGFAWCAHRSPAPQSRWRDGLALVLLLAACLCGRGLLVPAAPAAADSEETLLVVAAQALDWDGPAQVQVDIPSLGPVPVLAQGPALRRWGATVAAARFTAAGFDTTLLLVLFLALRRRFDLPAAMVGLAPLLFGVAALDALKLAHWHASTCVAELLALALLLIVPAANSKAGSWQWILAGAVIGLLPWVNVVGVPLAVLALVGIGTVWPASAVQRRATLESAGYVFLLPMAWFIGTGRGSFLARHYGTDLWRPSGLTARTIEATLLAMLVIGGLIAITWTLTHLLAARRRGLPAVSIALTAAVIATTLISLIPVTPTQSPQLSALVKRLRNGSAIRWGDRVALWGTSPDLYLQSEMAPALSTLLPLRPGEKTQTEFVTELERIQPPFVAVLAPNADRTSPLPTAQDVPALAEILQRDYVQLDEQDGDRLYMLAAVASERNVLRPGIVALTVESMTHIEVVGSASYLRQYENTTRIGTHAPAHYAHPIPADAKEILGGFGILPGAYANPQDHTDGATFIIEVTDAAGDRHRLFERKIDPFNVEADRGDQTFALDLTAFPNASQIDLIVDPGPSNAFDWGYWSDLRFTVPQIQP